MKDGELDLCFQLESFRRYARCLLRRLGHSEEYLPEGYDIEFAIPIKEFVTGTKDFNPGLCIKTRLKGPYSEITSVYARQHEWLEKEKYCCTKPPFDVYITNPYETKRPEDFITDVYLPVKKF